MDLQVTESDQQVGVIGSGTQLRFMLVRKAKD